MRLPVAVFSLCLCLNRWSHNYHKRLTTESKAPGSTSNQIKCAGWMKIQIQLHTTVIFYSPLVSCKFLYLFPAARDTDPVVNWYSHRSDEQLLYWERPLLFWHVTSTCTQQKHDWTIHQFIQQSHTKQQVFCLRYMRRPKLAIWFFF